MKIENRILLGIGSFVGMMLLVGWIIINEPARMEVFTDQWKGRSIEKGAEIYLNNCSSCHGTDSLGIEGVAPALKNPMLFLKDNPAKVAQADVAALNQQRATLVDQKAAYDAALRDLPSKQAVYATMTNKESDEAKKLAAEIEALNGALRTYDPETPTKITDLDAQIAEAQAKLDALKADGWDPTRDTRILEMGWAGSLRDYLASTVISGRPASKFYWPGAMPNWGQSSGGPLRLDEVNNVVDYLLNYEKEALKLTPGQLRQEFKLPVSGPPKVTIFSAGKPDVTMLDLAGGNADNGKTIYTNLGCAGCHTTEGGAAYAAAPTAGTYTRIVDVRLKADPKFANWTPEQYIAHSILYPNEYVVPNGTVGLMPQAFGDQLSIEDLRDLIAYISTYK